MDCKYYNQDNWNNNLIKIIDHNEIQRANGFEGYILLEYCPGGTLFDLIESKCKEGYNGITDQAQLIKIINDITNGLCYLHDKQIAHRDLKLENVLKGSDDNWKMCDFGSCTTRQYNSKLMMVDRQAVYEELEKVTTPLYRAPE